MGLLFVVRLLSCCVAHVLMCGSLFSCYTALSCCATHFCWAAPCLVCGSFLVVRLLSWCVFPFFLVMQILLVVQPPFVAWPLIYYAPLSCCVTHFLICGSFFPVIRLLPVVRLTFVVRLLFVVRLRSWCAAPFYLVMYLLLRVGLLFIVRLLFCCATPFFLCGSFLDVPLLSFSLCGSFLLWGSLLFCSSTFIVRLLSYCAAPFLICGSFLSCYATLSCCGDPVCCAAPLLMCLSFFDVRLLSFLLCGFLLLRGLDTRNTRLIPGNIILRGACCGLALTKLALRLSGIEVIFRAQDVFGWLKTMKKKYAFHTKYHENWSRIGWVGPVLVEVMAQTGP